MLASWNMTFVQSLTWIDKFYPQHLGLLILRLKSCFFEKLPVSCSCKFEAWWYIPSCHTKNNTRFTVDSRILIDNLPHIQLLWTVQTIPNFPRIVLCFQSCLLSSRRSDVLLQKCSKSVQRWALIVCCLVKCMSVTKPACHSVYTLIRPIRAWTLQSISQLAAHRLQYFSLPSAISTGHSQYTNTWGFEYVVTSLKN